MVDIALVIGPAAVFAALAVYLTALRTRHHYTSTLACPPCHSTFEYKRVPLASFSALRLGTSRYLECPLCHEWSTYNLHGTKAQDPGN